MEARSVTYHRNGVFGAGFYAVAFRDDGRDLIGIVFTDGENLDPARTAVIEPSTIAADDGNDPLEIYGGSGTVTRWRGDEYHWRLARVIRGADVEWRAAWDAREARDLDGRAG
jgi:hypothetical protein